MTGVCYGALVITRRRPRPGIHHLPGTPWNGSRMLDFFDEPARPSRRAFLRVGALGLGGLTLADLLRLEAKAASGTSGKSIIMVYLPGGPSHIDLYDMKPEAPAEIRGEFNPIPTNVPGMHLCELLPLQARIADKFAILRGLHTN